MVLDNRVRSKGCLEGPDLFWGKENDLDFNQLEMTNGSKYRVLVEFEQLVQQVDGALKAGGLLTLPMGIDEPGIAVTLNPQHIVTVIEGMY